MSDLCAAAAGLGSCIGEVTVMVWASIVVMGDHPYPYPTND